MNNYKRRKLGLSLIDDTEINKLKNNIESLSPISLEKGSKESLNYSTQHLKNINVGTLRKPKELLVISSDDGRSYNEIELKNTKYFYQKAASSYQMNGELINYNPKLNPVDQNNPYDPLFASFSRLNSSTRIVQVVSGVTGVNQGEQQKFYSLSSGFNKSQNIEIRNAGRNINGIYVPTGLFNNRQRYINTSLPFQADIVWNTSPTSGWTIRQRTSTNLLSSFRNLYFNNGNYSIPTGGTWSLTGFGNISGITPLPIVSELELEGFFKLASTRISLNKNKIYATGIGSTGVVVSNTSGLKPNNASWVTYPHNYYTQNYPAFNYDLIIVPEVINSRQSATGINDILVISTGIQSKKIIYVSPHKVYNFAGFWAELSESNRTPITGSSGQIKNYRQVYLLNSGNLLSVSSEETVFSGLNPKYFGNITGISGLNGPINENAAIEWLNLNQVKLQQSTNLKDTSFYKLYEPIYRKDTLSTGQWNGIIPSGVPFQIEILRSKNSEYGTNDLKFNIYASNYFASGTGSLTGNGSTHTHYISDKSSQYGLIGNFYTQDIAYSSKSLYEADYIAYNKANKKSRSKILGTLWDKGFTKTNNKVRKIAKLFNNGSLPAKLYCYNVNTPSGVVQYCASGIATSAGIRKPDGSIFFRPDHPESSLNYDNPVDPRSYTYTGKKLTPILS